MNETIIVKIVTPSNIVLECKALLVTMAGENGEFGVLPKHALLMASLKAGLMKIMVSNTDILQYFVYEGIAQITGRNINIVTEFAIDFTKLQQTEIVEKLAMFKETLNNETSLTKIDLIKENIVKYESLLSCFN